MEILGYAWAVVEKFWGLLWWSVSFIPGAQTIIILLAAFLVYKFMPAPLTRLIRTGFRWVWQFVSPPLRWGAVHILRLLVRLAGEEIVKNAHTDVRIERVPVPVSLSWRRRILVCGFWFAAGAASLHSYNNWSEVAPYVHHALEWVSALYAKLAQ